MSLSMRNYHVLSGSHFLDNNSLFVNMPRSRLTTTPRRLRSNAHRHPSVQTPGVSPRSVKRLRVDMLRGYLASYHLPTTGTKQQLSERLTKHIRSMATKKNQRSRGRPAKATTTKTRAQGDAPPTEPSPLESSDSSADEEAADTPPTEPRPLESSDSSAGEEEAGSQDSPSGDTDEASSQRPPSGGHKSKHHRYQSSLASRSRRTRSGRTSYADRHSDDQVSDRHIPRARRRQTSCSYSHKSHRHASSTSSESEASPPRRKRRRHRDSSLSSSSTSSSTSSTSDSSSSSRRRRHHKRRRHRRHHSSSTAAIASISCSPPLPGHLQDRIKRGKYVNFDKLLLPVHTPPLFTGNQKSTKQRKTQKRQVTDLNSWLEAWNRYATCRTASDPRMALELIKYQTVISLLFARYPATSVTEYDRLFRQAAARDRTMRWDSPKEDIYVWALTQPNLSSSNLHSGHSSSLSFRDRAPITARLGPPVKHNPLTSDREARTPSGKEICKRFNLGKCTRGEDCVFAHNCWYSNCQGDHPGKECPKRF